MAEEGTDCAGEEDSDTKPIADEDAARKRKSADGGSGVASSQSDAQNEHEQGTQPLPASAGGAAKKQKTEE